ncbi:MAG: alpha-L-fucosidase [Planctomycetes bacterium]|nr:alpha-L-fucosidase [Planctomycetota bacterium]
MKTAVPMPRQLEYQDWEMGLFLHFGIRTFYEGHRDWDGKPMSPQAFDPAEFDPDHWAATAKEAGMKYIVLTAKHHDGFANWPSKLTDFSVAASPWRDGKGDVVREFINACRRHGIRPGLYYSPADASQTEYPDDKAYDDYFINQIGELLTGYGEIDVLWFDGCGSAGHKYDWPRITAEIRRMQPNILIFNMGDPDFRWVGNEAGVAPVPIWNTVDRVQVAIDTDEDEKLGDDEPLWLPAECDCRMRLRNWFYSDQDEHTVKSVEELMGLYYYSVGRGCNLLLNIGPDRRGLLPDKDAVRLLEFGQEIRRRFGSPFATLPDFKEPDPNMWNYGAEEPFLVDHVVIQEDLTEGEHARKFEIEIFPGRDPVTLYQGENIGHKAICSFPLVAAKKLRVQVTEADGPVKLRALELHNVARA